MKAFLAAIVFAALPSVAKHSAAAESAQIKLIVKEVVLSPTPSRWVPFEGWLTPSEDDRHVAYRAQIGGKWKIVRDGISGKEYDEAHSQLFSPDSGHLAYVARKENQCFVVLDAVEGKPFSQIEAPTKDQWPFVFSPDGARLAYVGVIEKGKECVVVDGIKGPVFDEILRHSFSFSENSGHFAYAARRSGRGIVIKDGKEVLEAQDIFSDVQLVGGTQIGDTFGPFLSPDGERLACAIRRGTNWFTVIDGVESRPWDSIVQLEWVIPGKTGFSPDGRHFTYMAERDGKTSVMLDQKELARCEDGSYVIFSANGKQMAFVRGDGRPEGHGLNQTSSVVLNGIQGKKFEGDIDNLTFSPDGKKLAYTVTRRLPLPPELMGSSADPHDSFVVVHGGKEFHGVYPYDGVVFSPDSKHMAFCGLKNDKTVVVLDGNELPKSDDARQDFNVGFFAFSPDSKRWAYISEHEGKSYAVISGKEYGPYDYLCEPLARDAYIYFSPDSRHFAFQATRGDSQFLVVDGIEHEIQGDWLSNSLLRYDSSTKLHGLVMGKDNISRIEVEIVGK